MSKHPRPILLTGFEPFDGRADNPSWELAQALHGVVLDGSPIQAVQLPCAFDLALTALDAALAPVLPRMMVCLGLASTRRALSFERVAINLIDARIADNAGAQPIDIAVVPGAPTAYFTRLPIKAMARAAQDAGLPAEVSYSAGTFVCNQVFYGLLHRLQCVDAAGAVPAGFVHVPEWRAFRRHKSESPAELRQRVAAGLAACLALALTMPEDLPESAGTVC